MRIEKFKKYDAAYIVKFGGYNEDVMCESVKAIRISIVEVKGSVVTGSTHEMYGYLKKHRTGDLKNILTKRIKRKGKEIEFNDNECVAVKRTYRACDLLTENEMKLKMIDYIMHDFQTEDERDFGHEDESW